jgi:hypothetical protein
MRFSEYLRLDEGNYGHDVEKGRIPKKKKPNTVDDHGEVMLDPKTGKPFPAKGPLKDWQIPSLKEDHRQYDPNVTRENEEDESKSSTPPVITNPKHPDYDPNHPTNVRRRRNEEELAAKENAEEDEKVYLARRGGKNRRVGRPKSGRRSEDLQNDSLEIPMRDALGRLSIYNINEGVAHWKRQLKSKNITAAEKRKIQQKLHDKETRDRPRQLKRAGDPDTSLDIAVNAGDIGSESVTPAPKKQRVSTPAETAKNKKNAPKWVKKMSKKDRDARDANNVDDAEMRAGGEGIPRQRHLDEPK